MENDASTHNLNYASKDFDAMVIVDRSTDIISLLCTQLTYQGLIDEYIGIKNAHVELDQATYNPTEESTSNTNAFTNKSKKRKYLLNSTADDIFSKIKDTNFSQIGVYLNKIAKDIDKKYKDRHSAKTVKEIKDFVGNLSTLQTEHQALKLHTALSEILLDVTKSDDFGDMLEVQQS